MLETNGNNKYIVWATCLLTIPALFINLDLMPTLGDEATRALVALEFMIRKNYIFSTINGEAYYNKPPLYNWLLVFLFKYFHRSDEWILRLPAVLSLISFAGIIFYTIRKHVGFKIAALTAFAFLTFGRMLFYDSMLGHIDLLFSMTLYMAVYSIFFFVVKERYFQLYSLAYFLTSLAFLMKGLPALVFLGLSLTATMLYFKKPKALIHPAHFIGMFIFAAIIGVYFFIYSQFNQTEDFLKTLWSESSKRTAFENDWKHSLSFLFIFPFEYLFHLLPWSLLIFACFRRDFFSIAKNNPFIIFCLLIIIVNIPVYWISPETRPRYLFLLFPFMFTIMLHYYYTTGAKVQKKIASILIGVAFILFCVMALFPFFVEIHAHIEFKYLKAVVLFIALLITAFLFFKSKSQNLFYLPIALLIARIGFDLYVLPERATVSPEVQVKKDVITSASMCKDLPLFIYKGTFIKHNLSYYFTTQNDKILFRDYDGQKNGVYYIMEHFYFNERPFKKLFEFKFDGRYYFIVKSE